MVGFAGAHGDAFELFEFAEEVFDEMAPLVYLGVDLEFLGAAGVLRDSRMVVGLLSRQDLLKVRSEARMAEIGRSRFA